MVGGADGDGSLAMFHQSRYDTFPEKRMEAALYI
jgi:hypothetical protein